MPICAKLLHVKPLHVVDVSAPLVRSEKSTSCTEELSAREARQCEPVAAQRAEEGSGVPTAVGNNGGRLFLGPQLHSGAMLVLIHASSRKTILM